jgi:hypothetical protein
MADVLMREITCINYACPVCSKLSQSRIESEAKTLQDGDFTKFPDGLTVYIVFLKCAKPDCGSPVILLAPTKKKVSDGEFMTLIRENWSTGSAVCAQGYPPTYPYEGRIWKQLESER